MKRTWKAIAVIALIGTMAVGTSGCITNSGLWPASLGTVSKAINMDSYLSPGFARSHPTPCRTMTTGGGRFDEKCWIAYGAEANQSGGWPGDTRTWFVDYADDWTKNGPTAWGYASTNPRGGFLVGPDRVCPAGVDIDPYGCTIVVGENGWTLWGCEWAVNGNVWFCDGAERAVSVPYSGPLDWRTTMRASLDWASYVLNPVTCAWGLVSAEVITSEQIENCGDGPYPGFGNNGQLSPITSDPMFGPIEGPDSTGTQTKHVARVLGVK